MGLMSAVGIIAAPFTGGASLMLTAADQMQEGKSALKAGAAAGRDEAYRFSREARADLQPYRELGERSITGLEDLMSDPSSITQNPFYQFKLSEGLGGIERSKLAKGKFFSGETARDIIDYAEGLASSTYDTEWLKRFNLVNLGQSAAGGSANISQGLGSNFLQSLQTQGQDVASANSAMANMFAQAGMFGAGGGFGGNAAFGGKGMFSPK